MPAERLAAGAGLSGIPLVIEIEFFPTAEGHAVAKPGVGVLIIELIHPSNLPFQSNPNGSAENDDKSSDRPSPYEAQILCVFSPTNPFFVVYYTMLVFPSQALQSGEQGSRCKHTAYLSCTGVLSFMKAVRSLPITATQKAPIPVKRTNPAAGLLRSGVRLFSQAAERTYFR